MKCENCTKYDDCRIGSGLTWPCGAYRPKTGGGMDIEKLIEAVKLCGSTPKVDQCKQCTYWAGGDMSKCIPRMTLEAATTLEKLQAENDQLRDSRDRWKKCAEDFSAGVTQRDKEEERILAENEKLRADVVRLNDMLASYQNVLVPELRVENENLKERIEDTRLEWYAKGFGEVIAEVKRVRAELERVKRERDAAVECVNTVYSYILIKSKTEAVRTIEKWWRGHKED